jgi:Putative DNA-binding domain
MQHVHENLTGFGSSARARSRAGSVRRMEHDTTARRDRTSPIEALSARFPVTRRLVGELSFRIVARRFIHGEPPDIPVPANYGDGFPRFLRGQGNAASIEYVADVAELEMVRGKARLAEDARPLGKRELSLLRVERLNGLRVALHPSVALVQSRFPVVTIWESNQADGGESSMIERWCSESALVARPFLDVEVRRLPPGGLAFLRALAQGQTVATAAAIASAAAPKFELAANLALLQEANVVVGIREAA